MATNDDPPTIAAHLAGYMADIPEVGRGGGRVMSGTTGELAAVLGHVSGCQECRERWPAAEGMLILELLPSGHVGYTVELDGDPERLEVRRLWASAEHAPEDHPFWHPNPAEVRAGREAERASGASLEGGKEAPLASRPPDSDGTSGINDRFLDAVNRLARLLGHGEVRESDVVGAHLTVLLTEAADILENEHGRRQYPTW